MGSQKIALVASVRADRSAGGHSGLNSHSTIGSVIGRWLCGSYPAGAAAPARQCALIRVHLINSARLWLAHEGDAYMGWRCGRDLLQVDTARHNQPHLPWRCFALLALGTSKLQVCA